MDIFKLREFNKLKQVYRINTVGERKESSAEHSWSCMMLADYFFGKVDIGMDKLRVLELLMYHDVVEIESGDFPLDPNIENSGKEKIEAEAAERLAPRLPDGEKFLRLFAEYEAQQTIEAKYANAIDKFDALIHELDNKDDWKGWTKEFLMEKKEKYFLHFPYMHEQFLKIVGYLEKNGYFEK